LPPKCYRVTVGYTSTQRHGRQSLKSCPPTGTSAATHFRWQLSAIYYS